MTEYKLRILIHETCYSDSLLQLKMDMILNYLANIRVYTEQNENYS